jgi:chemotaxis protein methyltransferase WspC
MSILRVEALICDRLGLDPGALGASILPRTITNRMRANGATTPEDYLDLLKTVAGELETLASELVVSETWFFRGGLLLFERLARFVAERVRDRSPGFPVRVLSLPCSTGEEPYSLAIALHMCGVPPHAYQLEAADLSRPHIERAEAALYSEFAFREPCPEIRSKIFHGHLNHWIPLPQIRQAVRFRVVNVTDQTCLFKELPYDLLVCRNLFIYLTADGRRRAIATLDRLLAPDGCLCVSPAEADRLPHARFVPEGPIEFGIYRRVTAGSGLVPVVQSTPTKQKAIATDRPIISPKPSSSQPPIPKPPHCVHTHTLGEARNFANAGRLVEARAVCEELIGSQVELPGAYSLLGVIHQAEGRPHEAWEAFRRALYLAPNHIEAMTQMIVLCKSRGDASQVALLQKRLKRLNAEDEA